MNIDVKSGNKHGYIIFCLCLSLLENMEEMQQSHSRDLDILNYIFLLQKTESKHVDSVVGIFKNVLGYSSFCMPCVQLHNPGSFVEFIDKWQKAIEANKFNQLTNAAVVKYVEEDLISQLAEDEDIKKTNTCFLVFFSSMISWAVSKVMLQKL